MNNVKEYISSGLLELYVAGIATAKETAEVEQMAMMHTAIADEIVAIAKSLKDYAAVKGVAPDPTIKPFLLATIDYTERIKNGEVVNYPPAINKNSILADYENWLNRNDMVAPDNFDNIYAKIIGYTKEITTAIVWIKEMAPHEVHDDEIETFLIAEGSCNITIGEKVHQLFAGDVLSIPLYLPHFVIVTSAIPCKIILQRIAA